MAAFIGGYFEGINHFINHNIGFNQLIAQYFAGKKNQFVNPFVRGVVVGVNNNLFNFKAITIAYGGDWRFGRNVMLSYGIRTVYGQNFSFKQLVPVASIACMMR